ncbi:hypothetical protein K443DRAFT_11195 [Laccaria amethystina LaAM-08-1]|uniref:Uncharacterized protein n=1 Tax=Laccaria amethystina LaAM-08-1 TaxID=1095629 RepID=A0A0C9WU55_9AGAR|nr:hypothetical protein K443DRAFT_11195 [Laccaria amethystina LaAM-08-1]
MYGDGVTPRLGFRDFHSKVLSFSSLLRGANNTQDHVKDDDADGTSCGIWLLSMQTTLVKAREVLGVRKLHREWALYAGRFGASRDDSIVGLDVTARQATSPHLRRVETSSVVGKLEPQQPCTLRLDWVGIARDRLPVLVQSLPLWRAGR